MVGKKKNLNVAPLFEYRFEDRDRKNVVIYLPVLILSFF